MPGPKPQDISGQKFGMLTAIKRVGKSAGRVSIWLCKCDCGNEYETIISRLRNGTTTSCGCKKRVDNPVSNERLFRIWQSMRQRCNNPNANYYELYGGRGIKICPDWDKYKAFKEWALNNGYEEHLTIDRINNNEGYKPNNCRWVTMKEQQSNKNNNVFVKYNGEKITLAELSRRTGLSLPMLHRRHKAGYRGEKLWTKRHLQTNEVLG
ncbi:hypothetical protein SAMN05877753_1233 [Bacillus oleivorans]|uniref:Uncharacterized protein n=1 Tax=Bacillus oleivorans TaxID=1448271 RepID=A0A285D8K5_9BACI|nr:hypothetical protein [Bacillus oleivorans]SNX75945.1 hypothetical protein SAMN05877753_1233 [Bacillus oleivorans]